MVSKPPSHSSGPGNQRPSQKQRALHLGGVLGDSKLSDWFMGSSTGDSVWFLYFFFFKERQEEEFREAAGATSGAIRRRGWASLPAL